MNLKVKYAELDSIGNYINTKSSEINNNLESLKALIPEIENAWQGIDSKTYISNFSNFLIDEKNNNQRLASLGEIIKVSSKVYQKKDLEWENEIKKEGVYYEQ